ncbi:hypothetical protein HT031_002696 [Scenedesmus sp. PABB004]|nr:hypothetical protein HT031_002696 [Scenedesmus sp. PABB004]
MEASPCRACVLTALALLLLVVAGQPGEESYPHAVTAEEAEDADTALAVAMAYADMAEGGDADDAPPRAGDTALALAYKDMSLEGGVDDADTALAVAMAYADMAEGGDADDAPPRAGDTALALALAYKDMSLDGGVDDGAQAPGLQAAAGATTSAPSEKEDDDDPLWVDSAGDGSSDSELDCTDNQTNQEVVLHNEMTCVPYAAMHIGSGNPPAKLLEEHSNEECFTLPYNDIQPAFNHPMLHAALGDIVATMSRARLLRGYDVSQTRVVELRDIRALLERAANTASSSSAPPPQLNGLRVIDCVVRNMESALGIGSFSDGQLRFFVEEAGTNKHFDGTSHRLRLCIRTRADTTGRNPTTYGADAGTLMLKPDVVVKPDVPPGPRKWFSISLSSGGAYVFATGKDGTHGAAYGNRCRHQGLCNSVPDTVGVTFVLDVRDDRAINSCATINWVGLAKKIIEECYDPFSGAGVSTAAAANAGPAIAASGEASGDTAPVAPTCSPAPTFTAWPDTPPAADLTTRGHSKSDAGRSGGGVLRGARDAGFKGMTPKGVTLQRNAATGQVEARDKATGNNLSVAEFNERSRQQAAVNRGARRAVVPTRDFKGVAPKGVKLRRNAATGQVEARDKATGDNLSVAEYNERSRQQAAANGRAAGEVARAARGAGFKGFVPKGVTLQRNAATGQVEARDKATGNNLSVAEFNERSRQQVAVNRARRWRKKRAQLGGGSCAADMPPGTLPRRDSDDERDPPGSGPTALGAGSVSHPSTPPLPASPPPHLSRQGPRRPREHPIRAPRPGPAMAALAPLVQAQQPALTRRSGPGAASPVCRPGRPAASPALACRCYAGAGPSGRDLRQQQQQQQRRAAASSKYERIAAFFEAHATPVLAPAGAAPACMGSLDASELEQQLQQPGAASWHNSYDEEAEEGELCDEPHFLAAAPAYAAAAAAAAAPAAAPAPAAAWAYGSEANPKPWCYAWDEEAEGAFELDGAALSAGAARALRRVALHEARHAARLSRRVRRAQLHPQLGDLEYMQAWVGSPEQLAAADAAAASRAAGGAAAAQRYQQLLAFVSGDAASGQYRKPKAWHLTFDEDVHGPDAPDAMLGSC